MKSRFFDELPEECLKWLTPQQPAWGGGQGGGGGGASWGGSRGVGYGGGAARGANPAWSPGFLSTGSGTPPPKAAEPDRGIGIRTGQKVFHTKFGEGKVLALEGAGADARAQVNFSRHGVKWLALSVAKLTPVDD
jgi:DNA helicase-2/ATP-dependent DNA helicase PcrA